MSDPIKYVRLIARPNTWYMAGTEVFWEGTKADDWTVRRPTLAEWEDLKRPENAGIGCVGMRMSGGVGEIHEVDECYQDGEWCMIDEFDVEVVDEPKEAP